MKNDRHAVVEVRCETCGNVFLARKERVKNGLGRFCSRNCFHIDERERNKYTWGKRELAKTYKIGSRYAARWYDENGETRSESYARWWWEMNVGEIRDNMIVLFRDNNPLNIEPSNFYLGTKSDALRKGNATRKKDTEKWQGYIENSRQRQLGFKHTPESKAKISAVHKGKKLSEEHKLNISNASHKMWVDGVFDNVHKGKNNWRWKGGIEKEYPLEFNKRLRDFIKSRDNYQCQICSKNLYKSVNTNVHHRDGNKKNSDQNNLVLLCKDCHYKVHSKRMESPPIMAMRSELNYSDQDKDNNK